MQSNVERAPGHGLPKRAAAAAESVVAENKETPEWLEPHHSQAASVTDRTVVPLPGEHYLQHSHAVEISDGVRRELGRIQALV
ncbi:hypothetical protein [Arthrobacter sp. StoSoilB22]|uniref:hypothetical protein n=1 Tax=Arthrobacter sp. StoSoilB22 TaxID=2830996 RepID=UPI001CC677B3|nr:hypothetical protein [Arthrobacter sp. StoSoilB22]BCW64216.1 hypothetical protein StoSoilB22_31890 [Arthrobacter sp. StoSoilB22]